MLDVTYMVGGLHNFSPRRSMARSLALSFLHLHAVLLCSLGLVQRIWESIVRVRASTRELIRL